MRKLLYLFVASLMCLISSFGEESDGGGHTNWYSPQGGWVGGEIGIISIDTGDPENPLPKIKVLDNGETDFNIDEIRKIYEGDTVALAAIDALLAAAQAQVMAKNISENLDDMYVPYTDYTDGEVTKYAKITPKSEIQNLDIGTLSVKNYKVYYDSANKYYYLSTKQDGDAEGACWEKKSEVDNISLSENAEDGKLRIQGWDTDYGFGGTLGSLLASKAGSAGQEYFVMAKIGSSASPVFIKIGNIPNNGGGSVADDITISTNETGHVGELAIKGFYSAVTSGGLLVPAKDESDFTWKELNNNIIDDEGYGIEILGWSNPTTYESSEDVQTLITDSNVDTSSMYLLAQNNGEMCYVSFGDAIVPPSGDDKYAAINNDGALGWSKIEDSSSGGSVADDITISTNETGHVGELAIKGFYSADNYSVPYKTGNELSWSSSGVDGNILAIGSGGVSWSGPSGGNMYYGTGNNGESVGWRLLPNVITNSIEVDYCTINAELDAVSGVTTISLYGSEMIGGGSDLYGATISGGKLSWQKIPVYISSSNSAISVDNASINSNSYNSLQVYGWEDADNGCFLKKEAGGVSYKTLEGCNGIEIDTSVAGKECFGLSNWGNTCNENLANMLTNTVTSSVVRDNSKHKIACYYESEGGSTIHWLSLGNIVNYGSGCSTAIKFVGTDDSYKICGQGSQTNTVSFASETDSCVSVKIGGDDNGNVTITLGVYYK